MLAAAGRRCLVARTSLNSGVRSVIRDRIANAQKLDEALAEWTCAGQAEHLMERLQAAGVAASVVRFTPEVMACGHLERRGWFRRIDHPDMGEHRYNGHPWRFAGLPGTLRLTASPPG